MGSVERVDKTLLLNEFVFRVRRDAALREEWRTDLQALFRRCGLSDAEYTAVRDADVRRLLGMGVHQYLVPHILRLNFGVTGMTNDHPALTAYQRAFPSESRAAIGGTQWDRTDRDDG
jgi:Aromatic-ring-opening dioxygenase LigAB, LigA subunit